MSSEIGFVQPVHTLWFCAEGLTREEANIPPAACRVPFAGAELDYAGIALYVGFEKVEVEVEHVQDTDAQRAPIIVYPVSIRRD